MAKIKDNNNQEYWAKRLDEIAQRRFDLTNEAIQKELKELYDEVAKKVQDKVEDLYYKLLEEGDLKRSDIWTYKHYRDLEKQINREMVALGNKEIKLINGNLEWALQEIYKETGIVPGADKFALLSPAMVKAIVNRPWSAQHFTSTIWKNKEALAQQLKKGTAECIITGKSKDKLVETVMQKTKAGFNNADRVVRTELMHTINQGQIQRYKDTGYTKLVWNCAFDGRTCDDCGNLDGIVIDIDSLDVPPLHPRCRCTVCPLIDSLRSIEIKKNYDIIELQNKLDAAKIKGKVIEPPVFDVSTLKFDDIHVNYEREHRVTFEEAVKYIEEADIVIERWNGKVNCYYGKAGGTYVNVEEHLIRTSFKRAEFDDKTRLLRELIENEE